MEACICILCAKPFDLEDKVPKALACGHTYCMRCLRTRKPKTCFVDGTRFQKTAEQLPMNATLCEVLRQLLDSSSGQVVATVPPLQPPLQPQPSAPQPVVEQKPQTVEAVVQTDLPDVVPKDSKQGVKEAKPTREELKNQIQFWCLQCDKGASLECIDEHRVQNLRAVRAARCTQARTQIDALSSAESSLTRLQELLEVAVREVEPELERCRGRLKDEEGVVAEARDRLEAALVGEAAEWEQAKQAVPEFALCSEAAQFLADLSGRGVTCSLTVAAEGADDAAASPRWKGRVALQGTALAKLLLCHALLQGGLERHALPPEELERRQRERREEEEHLRRLALEEEERVRRLAVEEEERLRRQALEEEECLRRAAREVEERLRREEEERVQREREQQELLIQQEREEELRREREYAASALSWTEQSNDVARALAAEEMSARVRKGCMVGPGRDWSGDPRLQSGMVTEVRGDVAVVRWTSQHGVSEHSIGRDGEHCLRLKRGLGGYMSSINRRFNIPPVMELLDLSSGHNIGAKTQLLASGELQEVKSLLKLRCDVSPAWAERVLEQVAARLEALVLHAPSQRHLDIVRDMPRLRLLCFTSDVDGATLPLHLEELYFRTVTSQQFAQIAAMPRLQRLQIHCPLSSPLAAVAFPRAIAGLRWLRTGVYPLSAALALVRANAATLEELELVAAAHAPYGCPDLAHELRRVDLKCLRRLVLLRNSINGFCRHDAVACEQQKLALWTVLVEARCLPAVLCTICDEVAE